MASARAAVLVLLVACEAEATPVAGSDRIELDQAVLRLGDGVEITANTASLSLDGKGEGSDVFARLPGSAWMPGSGWTGQVAATPPGAEPPPLQVEAPRSTWDLRARTAHFEGGVTVIRGPVTLTCDALDVVYGGPDRLERAVAEGGVVVTRGERRATGERAELTTATGEVVLSGAPTLSEGPNSMSGDRIVLWLDDEKVDCERCRLIVEGNAVAPSAGGVP